MTPKKVLVVDDEEAVREVLCGLIKYFTGKSPDQADSFQSASEQ